MTSDAAAMVDKEGAWSTAGVATARAGGCDTSTVVGGINDASSVVACWSSKGKPAAAHVLAFDPPSTLGTVEKSDAAGTRGGGADSGVDHAPNQVAGRSRPPVAGVFLGRRVVNFSGSGSGLCSGPSTTSGGGGFATGREVSMIGAGDGESSEEDGRTSGGDDRRSTSPRGRATDDAAAAASSTDCWVWWYNADLLLGRNMPSSPPPSPPNSLMTATALAFPLDVAAFLASSRSTRART